MFGVRADNGKLGRRAALSAFAAALALSLLPVATAQGANAHASSRAVCPTPPAAHGHCYALVVTDRRGNPRASSAPKGLSPESIRAAYGFPAEGGAGETIAIVDAYDDPSAESDLNTFSAQFGLPACTSANGCFRKVDQRGGVAYPRANSGWALEISLDVQWAHAIAPQAKILLVEAESNSFANLLAAEDYAAAQADYVSNSWGGSESRGESSYDSHFEAPGVSFFVAAGDSGLPAEYPSSSPDVISVGGTTLHFDEAGNFSEETGWSEGGGGCSAYESASPAQSAFGGYGQVGCGGRRATPDVALDADPSSGVAVYDSTKYYGQRGWFTVGGTSASTPMWAGRSAVAGALVDASYVYGSSIGFRDIVSGNNGAPCLTGFDLCSGRGSWAAEASPPPPEEPPVLTAITISPSEATLFEGEAQEFVAHGKDQHGNPIEVTGAEWTTTAPGSLSQTSGAATVFSADSGTGNGVVTAKVGSIEGSATVTVTEEPTLTAPTNLTASPQGRHISLSWQGGSPGLTYDLYRGTSPGGEAEEPYATGLTETSAKDMGVASGTTYYYYVTAVGPGGEESIASNEASAEAR